MLRKQRERGIFMQNTRVQVHFRDSLFVGKISINPCCSAGKETKKLLASVSTSASREWLLVEQMGFEPTTPTMRTWCSSQLSYCPESMRCNIPVSSNIARADSIFYSKFLPCSALRPAENRIIQRKYGFPLMSAAVRNIPGTLRSTTSGSALPVCG